MDVFAQEAIQAQQTIDLVTALMEGMHQFDDAPIQPSQAQMDSTTRNQHQPQMDDESTPLNHLTLFVSGTCPRLEHTDLAWQLLVLEDWRVCMSDMFHPSTTTDWLPSPVANPNDYTFNDCAPSYIINELTSSSESLDSSDDTDVCGPPISENDDVPIEWQLALSEVYVNEYEDLIFQLVFCATTDMDADMARKLSEVTTQHAFDLTQHKHLVFQHNMLIVRPSD